MKTPITLLAAAFILRPLSFLLAQGSLTPPGAPAPTMKTLDQIEPRIPLVVGSPGVTTEANYHFVISQPGSYYLTGNLNVTKTNGIDIRAEGVTLDLMGFEIRRTAGTPGGFGVEIDDIAHRYTIKNGSITGGALGFSRCVFGQPNIGARVRGGQLIALRVSRGTSGGIDAGDGCLIDRCTAYDNAFNAIGGGAGSTITNCTAYGNQGTYAIVGGPGSTLSYCSASGNQVSTAIRGGAGSTVTSCTASENVCDTGIGATEGSTIAHCTARANTSAAAFSAGIVGVNGRSTIIGCTASDNTSTNATPTGDTGIGIAAGAGATIRNCTASGNLGTGIRVSSGNCLVAGNNCYRNGGGPTGTGDGAGIHVAGPTGQRSCIEGNTVTANDRGIDVDTTFNFVLKNLAGSNTTNYDIVASNAFGPIVTVAAVGDISGTANSNHPAANFSY